MRKKTIYPMWNCNSEGVWLETIKSNSGFSRMPLTLEATLGLTNSFFQRMKEAGCLSLRTNTW